MNESEGAWWRPVPERRDCRISLPLVPPGSVDSSSIRLIRDVVREDSPPAEEEWGGEDGVIISLALAWDPPADPYGAIQRYDVYIGQSLLEGTDPTSSAFSTVS